MNALRKIVTLKDNILKVELPEEYRDQTVELIILRTEKPVRNNVQEQKVDYVKFMVL